MTFIFPLAPVRKAAASPPPPGPRPSFRRRASSRAEGGPPLSRRTSRHSPWQPCAADASSTLTPRAPGAALHTGALPLPPAPAAARLHAPSGAPSWPCPACTLLNRAADPRCALCGAARSGLPGGGGTQACDSDGAFHAETLAGAGADRLAAGGAAAASARPGRRPAGREKRPLEGSDTEPPAARLNTSAEGDRSTRLKTVPVARVTEAADGRQTSGSPPAAQSLLASLHAQRMARLAALPGAAASVGLRPSVRNIAMLAVCSASAGTIGAGYAGDGASISILTYNVWFREDVALKSRMQGIGNIILQHRPQVVCLQEVTPNIYRIFCQSGWWSLYRCSLTPAAADRDYYTMQLSRIPDIQFQRHPYSTTCMSRELCIATVPKTDLVVATTHLESPCPAPPLWNQMFSAERVAQAKEAFRLLGDARNMVFCGDMNWSDDLDGPPPLPPGWLDAWCKLRPGEAGHTYDSKTNPMLTGRLRKRLDRVFCRLADYELETIETVGQEAIEGAVFEKERTVKRVRALVQLPVLPSDHYGLLVRIRKREDAGGKEYAVKVALGQEEQKTAPQSTNGSYTQPWNFDYDFPVPNLQEPLVVTLIDSGNNGAKVSTASITTPTIMQKGIVDDFFELDGGGRLHLKLSFILSQDEREKIQLMRQRSQKEKAEAAERVSGPVANEHGDAAKAAPTSVPSGLVAGFLNKPASEIETPSPKMEGSDAPAADSGGSTPKLEKKDSVKSRAQAYEQLVRENVAAAEESMYSPPGRKAETPRTFRAAEEERRKSVEAAAKAQPVQTDTGPAAKLEPPESVSTDEPAERGLEPGRVKEVVRQLSGGAIQVVDKAVVVADSTIPEEEEEEEGKKERTGGGGGKVIQLLGGVAVLVGLWFLWPKDDHPPPRSLPACQLANCGSFEPEEYISRNGKLQIRVPSQYKPQPPPRLRAHVGTSATTMASSCNVGLRQLQAAPEHFDRKAGPRRLVVHRTSKLLARRACTAAQGAATRRALACRSSSQTHLLPAGAPADDPSGSARRWDGLLLRAAATAALAGALSFSGVGAQEAAALPQAPPVLNAQVLLLDALPERSSPIAAVEAALREITTESSGNIRSAGDKKGTKGIRPWQASCSAVSTSKATGVVQGSAFRELLNTAASPKKAAAASAAGELKEALGRLASAAQSQDSLVAIEAQQDALLALDALGSATVRKFPYNIPQEYSSLARLMGRAVLEMNVKYKTDGGDMKKGSLLLELDGFNAPITAGNFVDLVNRGFYDGIPFDSDDADGLFLQAGDPAGDAQGYVDASGTERTIPLEIKIAEEPTPVYGETLEEAGLFRSKPVLPFSAYGTLAMGRPSDEPNGASSQFFFLKFDPASTPAGLNLYDGNYSVFGYAIKGQRLLDEIHEGDTIESIRILSGAENFQPQG
eukprot:SM000414S15657  [mRNA]  locus=s414:17200:28773:- [translate_table: standard]